MLPRLALPPSPAVLALIALAFVAPGLVGHDPWRAFDVITIDLVSQMHLTGDWLVPRLAGDPFLEDPPLYCWVALAFAKTLGEPLGFHNAVRLASGLAMLAAIWFLFKAGRALEAGSEEKAVSASAPLILIGSVGLVVHAHEAVPDLAALAAVCAGFFFLFADRNAFYSGAGFGASLGIAFLSSDSVMPVVLWATALLAHAVCDEWRNARAARFLATGIIAFGLVAASWPFVLWLRAPDLALAWWSGASTPRGGFLANLRYYLATASWSTWPAWPLAAWSAWALRKNWRAPRFFVPLAAALIGLPVIAFAGPQQDINTIALIAPLALLGAQGVPQLRRGAANALDWFGVITFTICAAVVWLCYIAAMIGLPPQILRNVLKTAPGFVPQFEPAQFAAALALTLAWLYLAFFVPPSRTRGVARWAAGVAVAWGTFATLGLTWLDYVKSYRSVALQLKAALPPGAGCISQRFLGDPQRAALSYHAGIRIAPAPTPCPLLIVQGSPRHENDAPGAGWRKLAEAGRPGDRGERYRLYRRTPG
jgi:4-amino-4-deoxy-L-arabinose transferase-like glycosyltransferase